MVTTNISTKELSAQLYNPEFLLVDIRPSAAYNGWKLQDEERGGHIRGAVSFPFFWINDLSYPELKALLLSKGITSRKTIVLYGYKQDSCSIMVKVLLNFGINKVLIYEAGLQEWAADSSLPMEYLENYQKLVTSEWVRQLISGKTPENFPDTKSGLFEVGWGNLEEYMAGHIPGAFHFDLSSIESPKSWNKCSDEDLLEFLLAHGITFKSLVVLYGRDLSAAARAACILMYAGVEDVRLLDGGFDAWLNAGYTLELGFQQPIPLGTFGRRIPGHPEYIIGINKAKALLADGQGMLVSIRSWEEYIGETSGYEFIKPKGRIAGAVWGYSGSDPHQMQDYRNLDNTMRSYHEIASLWQNQGITPDKNVGFYCGTGWRASEAFFYAYLMGRQNIAVFDGGWLEWSENGSNPIERGIPIPRSSKL